MNIIELNLNEVATIAGGAKKPAKKFTVSETPAVPTSSGSNWGWWVAKNGGKLALALGCISMSISIEEYYDSHGSHYPWIGKFVNKFFDGYVERTRLVQSLLIVGICGITSFIW
jgi:hypothetical protein